MSLINCLGTTEQLAKLFSDHSILAAMLQFETALAEVEARHGIVPKEAAEEIAAAANLRYFDVAKLAEESLRAGTPGMPLANALRRRVQVGDAAAPNFVHWGATSQDVCDTALILLLKKTQRILDSDLARLKKSLRELSDKHAHTVMLGRTLLQPAPPVTFGLKAAGWLAAMERSHRQLTRSFADALNLQFGGASGTQAMLGDQGIAVGKALADELGLQYPEAPWHTHRDRLAALMCACGVLTGSVGKIARDISLLSQAEIGEVAEASGYLRGGSSTMPHKQNPIGCVLSLAAANRVPGLVATFLSGMVQEHERGAGGGQAEWPTVAAIVQSTGVAIESMAGVAEGLVVNPGRMRSNIEATNGTVFAEKAMILLARSLGRDAANKLLESVTRQAMAEGRRLAALLAAIPEVKHLLDAKTLADLETPELYLGAAEEFRRRLLASELLPPQNKKE